MTNQVVVDHRFENTPAKIVLKYRLDLRPDPLELEVPVGARLLHTSFIWGMEPLTGHWLLWYEVPLANHNGDVNHKMVYQSIATGVPFPKCAKWMASGERFESESWQPTEVWHLYEYPSGAKVVDA